MTSPVASAALCLEGVKMLTSGPKSSRGFRQSRQQGLPSQASESKLRKFTEDEEAGGKQEKSRHLHNKSQTHPYLQASSPSQSLCERDYRGPCMIGRRGLQHKRGSRWLPAPTLVATADSGGTRLGLGFANGRFLWGKKSGKTF